MAGSAADLLADAGVLADEPVLEWQGHAAVARVGGVCITPWRQHHLQARALGLASVPSVTGLDAGQAGVGQAVVHVQKSRPGTWRDLADAWSRLRPGGRLLVLGGNELGIKTTVRRLAAELEQVGQLLANRHRARLHAFIRADGCAGPVPPVAPRINDPLLRRPLTSAPGIFADDRLDAGSRLLLEALPALDGAPRRIVDLGCGTGVLALQAAERWPGAELALAEADWRALTAARTNLAEWGHAARATTHWWSAGDLLPLAEVDLVLLNPPWHSGRAADFAPARAMFAWLDEHLQPGGRALIVANRQLPYERDLADLGGCSCRREAQGFKLFHLER